MKKLMVATTLTLLLAFNAEAAHSNFICSYEDAETGTTQALTFEGSEEINLLHTKSHILSLVINDQPEPIEFNVNHTILHVSDEIELTSKNKFFVSDFKLRIVNHVTEGIRFNGTWKTDSPFVAKLNCIFLN